MCKPIETSWEAILKSCPKQCRGQSTEFNDAAGNTYEKHTYENGGLIAVFDSQGRRLGVHSVYGCFELPAEKEGGYRYENCTS